MWLEFQPRSGIFQHHNNEAVFSERWPQPDSVPEYPQWPRIELCLILIRTELSLKATHFLSIEIVICSKEMKLMDVRV